MKTWLGLLVAIVAVVLAVVPLAQFSRLHGRFQEVEKKLGEVTGKVEGVESTLKSLPDDFSKLSDRVVLLEEEGKRLLDVSQTMDTLKASVKALEGNQSVQQGILAETQEKLQTVERKIIETEGALKSLPDQFARLSDRVVLLEEEGKRLLETISSLAVMSERVDSLSSSFQEIVVSQREREKVIADVQEKLGTQEQNIETLSNSLKALSEKWPEWVEKLENLGQLVQTSLSEIGTWQEKLGKTEEGFARQFSEIEGVLQGLQKGFAELQEAFGALDVDQRFAALWQHVQDKELELQSRWEEVQKRLERQDMTLQGIEGRFAQEIETLKVGLDEVQKSLSALNGEITQRFQMLSTSFQELSNLVEEKRQQWEEISERLTQTQREYLSQQRFNELALEWQQQLAVFEESLRGLAEQVEKKWQELEGRLKTVENLGSEQSQRLKEIKETLEPAIEELGGRISVLEGDLEKSKTRFTEVENKFRESAQIFENLYRSIEEAGKNLALWEEKWQELTTWREGLGKEIQERVSQILTEIPDGKKLAELEKEVAGMLSAKEEILSQLRQWYEERDQLKQELEGKKKDIEVLAKRIAEEETFGRATQEVVTSLREELTALSSYREGLEKKVQQFDAQITELEAGLRNYETRLDDLLSTVNLGVQRLTSSIETIQEEIKTLRTEGAVLPQEVLQTLVGIEKSFGDVSQRLREVENFVQDFFQMGIENRLSSLNKEVQAVAGRIEDVAKQYPDVSAQLEMLRKAVEELQKDKQEIEERLQSFTQDVETLRKEKEIQGDVESLSKEKERLRQEIEILGGEKLSLEDELRRRQDEVEKIREELAKLEAQKGSAEEIRRLQETLKKAEEGVGALQEKLREKENQIELLQQRNEELTRRLEETKKYTSYVILPWDNLWTIARRYYRDGRKWKAILEANKDIITDPQKLQPYVEIRIPRQINDEPMEADYGEK